MMIPAIRAKFPQSGPIFAKEDIFVELAARRSPLHAGCLLELAELCGRRTFVSPTRSITSAGALPNTTAGL
jgi:hypothetical protein